MDSHEHSQDSTELVLGRYKKTKKQTKQMLVKKGSHCKLEPCDHFEKLKSNKGSPIRGWGANLHDCLYFFDTVEAHACTLMRLLNF